MRYIDHTNCKTAFEKGEDHEIQSLGKLTRTATKIAEANGLGVLKNRQGYYRIIKKSGYDGFVSLEFEGMEDPLQSIEIGLANLKRYIAMLEA